MMKISDEHYSKPYPLPYIWKVLFSNSLVCKKVSNLYGVSFTLETDHRCLKYLENSTFTNWRLMRWAPSVQSYQFEIDKKNKIKRENNCGSDYSEHLPHSTRNSNPWSPIVESEGFIHSATEMVFVGLLLYIGSTDVLFIGTVIIICYFTDKSSLS